MKKLTLSIVLSIITTTIFAQNVNLEWAKSMGGTLSQVGYSITTDNNGNVYTTGLFQGTADFDPGVGVFNLASNGGDDIFIQKLDVAGNFIWAKSMGDISSDHGHSITTDNNGNVYTIGRFSSTVDFDPGAGVFNLTSNGSIDIFVQKLDANGNFIWAKSMGGSSSDYGHSITTDNNGNVYTTGRFSSTVDFDPGAGVFNLTSNGQEDIFVQKLDANGNFIWTKNMGDISYDLGWSIITDSNGNVYTTGSFQNTVDFDPGAGVFNLTSNGSYDIFIQKLDANGNFVWAKSMGGSNYDIGYSITTDHNGNIYITGYFMDTVDFDPGIGLFNLISNGSADIFIQKIDTAGNFIWAKALEGFFNASGYSIKTDNNGSVYTTGFFSGTVDFDPGVGVFNLASNGDDDIFIQKLDVVGNFIWAKSMGGSSSDYGHSITTDNNGNVYTTGSFQNTVDFDPGVGVFNLTSNGIKDIFVQKLSLCIASTSSDTRTECSPFVWIDGNTYTSNNTTAKDTLVGAAANGCDSIVTLNLTILNSATGTDVQTACNSYLWTDGNTYTANNNTAKDTIVGGAFNGCDSIVTLNLTIFNTVTATDTRTECSPFVWIDGNTYTTNNTTAKDTLVAGSVNGCDSIVTLNLTITIVDTSVTQTGTDLTANELVATYQWLDCDNNYAVIPGETFRTYYVLADGNYAVEVTYYGCADTSSCYNVIVSSVAENTVNNNITIYPNPVKNQLTITAENEKINSIKIMDVTGKTLKTVVANTTTINVADLAKGIYFLQIQTEKGIGIKRFIKE